MVRVLVTSGKYVRCCLSICLFLSVHFQVLVFIHNNYDNACTAPQCARVTPKEI